MRHTRGRADGGTVGVQPTSRSTAALAAARTSSAPVRPCSKTPSCLRSRSEDAAVEDPDHLAALVAPKRQSREGLGTNRPCAVLPEPQVRLRMRSELGGNIGGAGARLGELLDAVDRGELAAANAAAFATDAPHAVAVRPALDRRRHDGARRAQIALGLPNDPRVRNPAVRLPALVVTDALDGPKHGAMRDELAMRLRDIGASAGRGASTNSAAPPLVPSAWSTSGRRSISGAASRPGTRRDERNHSVKAVGDAEPAPGRAPSNPRDSSRCSGRRSSRRGQMCFSWVEASASGRRSSGTSPALLPRRTPGVTCL